MRDPRIHHPEPLTDDTGFMLSASAARHLLKVLRFRAGDRFTAFDGRGDEWPATLVDTLGAARTGRARGIDRESPLAVTLVQGVSRAERMDATIQKAVELGAVAVQPVVCARSVVRLDGERAVRRADHWQAVAVSACEQCGRNRVPPVHPPLSLTDWLASPRPHTLILHPGDGVPIARVTAAHAFALLVGPEGGFDDGEVAAAVAAGCTPVGLGPRVLRTETAGPAALAALQALYGDYR